jgi:methionine aminotransferase
MPATMTSSPLNIVSRLPQVGTTIFSVMSALANQHQAINLGQGFPDFDCNPALVEAVHRAMRDGHNQYPPMPGAPVLLAAIATKIEALYGHQYDLAREITVTAGATQAILTTVLALVHPGDEVIVLEPCYDSYLPSITLAGGIPVRVPLTPGTFRPDFDRIRSAMTPRTRAIIVNTPHNPSGTVWTAQEMDALAQTVRNTPVLVISDEVYEHMVFDGLCHASIARHPELVQRAVLISSFGKTYHVTGWKVGYVAAPAALMAEFRKVHQFNVFTVNTPMQHGIAAYMSNPAHHNGLATFYQQKRDLFRAGLADSRLKLLPCEGTYFQCVDISNITDKSEADFCEWLVRDVGVAAIPVSAFYANAFDQKVVRFCFAKQESTLQNALQRLQQI